VVPEQVTQTLKSYLVRRKELMNHIEQQDMKQLRNHDQ
jgi:hypothetical protein